MLWPEIHPTATAYTHAQCNHLCSRLLPMLYSYMKMVMLYILLILKKTATVYWHARTILFT